MKPTPVFIDDAGDTLFYLAFDLLLAHAPIRDGLAHIREGSVVKFDRDDPATGARHAAIRAALLAIAFPDRTTDIEEERARAGRLAADAELAAPPALDGRFTAVVLDGGTTLPDAEI